MRGRLSECGSVLVMGVFAAACLSSAALAQDPSSSPEPSAARGPGALGADQEVYRDSFDVPTTWELVDDEVGRTAYEDGGLVMSVLQDRSSVWDDHQLPAAHPVLRVEVEVSLTADGSGGAGPACGSSLGLPRWLFAAINEQEEWIFGRIIDTRLQVIDRGLLPIEVDATATRLAIECASVPEEGGDYALLTADGLTLTKAFDIPVGPYDKATLVVSSDTAPVEAMFEDLVVHAGDAYDPSWERDPDAPSR